MAMITHSFVAALGLLLLLPDGSSVPRGRAPIQVSFEERCLGTLPEGRLEEWFNVSHFGTLWYRATIGNRTFTVVSGRKMWEFPSATFETFSPEGDLQAHWERRNGEHWLVLDDREFGPFEEHSGPAFSRDSRMVYAGKRRGRWTVFSDSNPLLLGEGTTDVTLVDGDRVRVVTRGERNGNRFFGVDGREWEVPGAFWMGPEVSSSGLLALLIADKEGDERRKRVVVNGVAGAAWKEISWPPTFSADGKRIAYVAQDSMNSLIVDGAVVTQDQTSIAYPTFSPDGRRLAYRIEVRGDAGVLGEVMVVDGCRSDLSPRSVSWPVFSPDSRRVAYKADKEDCGFVVVEGVKGPEFGCVWPDIQFSPDSRRVAYRVSEVRTARWGRMKVVVDGKEGEVFEKVDGLVFSPDSRHTAYVAEDRGMYWVVVDGAKSEAFDHAWMPVFRTDSRKLAFGARRGRELWWKVCVLDK